MSKLRYCYLFLGFNTQLSIRYRQRRIFDFLERGRTDFQKKIEKIDLFLGRLN